MILLNKTSKKDLHDYKKCLKIIPDSTQTLSKMPDKYIRGIYPIYIDKGKGCYVYNDTTRYIDYPCSLGAILLGYSHFSTIKAINNQIKVGNIFSFPNRLEYILAEKITNIIPCAEMVRFVKTGSESCSAAIKIARTYTGKNKILTCGYHGWHDWYSILLPKNKGIPEDYSKYISKFIYNSFPSVDDFRDTAAIIMEPYFYDYPDKNYLKNLISLAHKNNCLVIFDEVITGFRTKKFSAQKMFDVMPDLSCFGKAAGNGVPVAWVCGKKEIMKVLEKDCFVSSTFGGDLLGISAALSTIEFCEKNHVISSIWKTGQQLKEGFNIRCKNISNTQCIGYPCRTLFKFESSNHRDLFWQECARRGVLFGFAQFITYSHTKNIIDKTLDVVDKAMKIVEKFYDNPLKGLVGLSAKETMRKKVEK